MIVVVHSLWHIILLQSLLIDITKWRGKIRVISGLYILLLFILFILLILFLFATSTSHQIRINMKPFKRHAYHIRIASLLAQDSILPDFLCNIGNIFGFSSQNKILFLSQIDRQGLHIQTVLQILINQMQNETKTKQQKHTKYTVSVRIKPNLNNEPVCIYPHQSKFIKEIRPKSIVTYGFDKIFEESNDNAFIYESSLKRTLGFFLHKKINTTILAYGQTGSGKTFTLFGSKTKGEKGLVDFMIEDIIDFATSKKLKVQCSFMQIYKEKVTDLMTSSVVQLRQNSSGDLLLENLKIFEIEEKQELLNLLKEAHSNKIFGNSYINSESSRSHVVFTIELQKRKFNIVDLCGSEVLTYKFNEQQRDETNSINLSLFTLNSVISDLALKQSSKNKFIPFRNSTLTRILKQSLLEMEKSQIYLFCNVSPEEKHQNFTTSTLRFGQLAIRIDEANNVVEEKVNLSQQKRQKKMVSNIIDIKPQLNKSATSYNINWKIGKVKILENHIKTYELIKELTQYNILLLHAYGGGCDGTDWNLFVSYLSQSLNASFYSVDFPGFGHSQGKKFTSRAQKFGEKDQAIEFMTKIFQHFGFSSKNKVVLLGYDLGGAIGLSCSFHPKLMKIVDSLIVLHPTWTDSTEKLAVISLPTLLLWFPLENFHLISAGQKMAKVIKSSRLYRFNINPVDYNQVGGYYDNYAETMTQIMSQFLKENRSGNVQQEGYRMRGKIVEQNIEVNLNQQEEKLLKARDSVKQIYRIIEEGKIKQVYEALLKGGSNKPKYSRLIGQLPDFDLRNITWEYLQKYLIFIKTPQRKVQEKQASFFIPNQQIQVSTLINLNCLQGDDKYLAYDPNGQNGITHKAYVVEQQSQEQMIKNDQILVSVADINQKMKVISVPLSNALYLNSPTCYKKNNLGHLVFEDSVTCNYNSSFVKLKFLQICYSLQEIVGKMDFNKNDSKLLDLQKECSKRLFQSIDLRHLVHEGIDNTRYTGTDVGKLAYYGQGNCHHLASVTAALLLPFGKLLGWQVIFRAGSFFKTGRQIDEDGNPLKEWNGKPRVNVEDHTWLEIRYKPSYQTFVFDPSFAICSRPLNEIYSFEGRMHISGKKLNFALEYQIPEKIFIK